MIRNLEVLGLLAFAALAMSAMFASAASAQKGVFTAGDTPNTHTPATITGTQYDKPGPDWNFFEAPKGSGNIIKCDNAHFNGTDADGTATSVTIAAEYTECDANGSPATVTMNGCDYVFNQPTAITGGYTGTADLTCNEGGSIVVHVYLFGSSTASSHSFNVCTIEVFPNESSGGGHDTDRLGGHLLYTPKEKEVEGKKYDDLTVEADISGISFDNGCTDESGSDGIYKNTVTMTASEDEGEHNLMDAWISPEEEE